MHAQTSPGFRLVFNKGYTPNGLDEKVYHLHVRYSGDWDELYFRDYLQKYPQVADEYGRLKLELAGRCRHDRDGYTNAKADFIRKYTRLATDEFKGRYTPADAKPGE
ncbi:hypothetical protein SDC9_142634 [bioreactor metagenome]|uniref:GrpB family protein n=1 Tax=bioreactor metagenome TaxID=1076179 RepID=A0A645E143_9ZZZZ